ncbi:restriction endonuclease subunit S [Vibrio parahaemolyticus]|uniref:restriction endonuclease subunit S n=1 Tax=Vibrio parahaemolyticus TaxID=670 RepID=UPI002361F48A|nr:restriction endonuclease subunit S [Vibrio parahaemolyticus]
MSWGEVSLGELEGSKGDFVDGPFGSNLKASEYVETGVPIIQLKNIKPNQYIEKDLKFVTQDKADSLKRHSYQAGDVCIAKLGAVGTACIIPETAPNGVIVADVVRFRGDRTRIDYKYLCYFLNSAIGQQRILAFSRGSTRTRTNLGDLKKVKIPLPPLEEQKRIAAILDKADAIRQKRKQAIDLADDFLRSVFLDMFGDPVTNPKGWEVKNIVDLAAKEKHAIKRGPFGGALKKDIFVDSGYLVYEQYHALNNDFKFARYFIDESKYQELEAFKVSVGDIIISCSGVNLGRLAIVPEGSSKGIINQALLKVKLDESKMLNDMFVAIFTHPNFKNEFFGDHRGSGVPNFPPMSTFKEFGFIVPPLDEQKRYLKVVDKVRELKRKIVNSVSSADEQFNSLSQKAFSGQL